MAENEIVPSLGGGREITMEKQQFQRSIAGLVIIFYSPHAVRHIEEGEDYLGEHYWEPKDVLPHIYEGSIVEWRPVHRGAFT